MTHPLQIAVMHHQQGQLDKARTLYEQHLEMEPDHPQTHNLLGILHLQSGRPQPAVTHLRRAVALSPDESAFHNNLGNALRASGDAQGARDAWAEAVRLDPSSADAWCNLGVSHMEAGVMGDAVDAWNTALTHNPRHPDALNLISVYLAQQGQRPQAITNWRTALEAHPQHSGARSNLAAALRQEGLERLNARDLDPALAALKEAVTLTPQDLGGWMLLSSLHQRRGALREAFEAAQRALQIDPQRPEIHHNIGNLLKETGQTEQAIHAFRRALELGSTHPATRHALAALTGEGAVASPAEVVRDLFDDYAERFDEHLEEVLEYQTPTRLREMAGETPIQRLLDLGCGTGLSGAAFDDLSAEMIGVDLSEKMLDAARQKGLYQELRVADLIEILHEDGPPFDGFVAADVLVYLGDLSELFAGVARRASQGARFWFSVEEPPVALAAGRPTDYTLLPSERFAHHAGYIERLAREHGFTVTQQQRTQLRKDEHGWIEGRLFELTQG